MIKGIAVEVKFYGRYEAEFEFIVYRSLFFGTVLGWGI